MCWLIDSRHDNVIKAIFLNNWVSYVRNSGNSKYLKFLQVFSPEQKFFSSNFVRTIFVNIYFVTLLLFYRFIFPTEPFHISDKLNLIRNSFLRNSWKKKKKYTTNLRRVAPFPCDSYKINENCCPSIHFYNSSN